VVVLSKREAQEKVEGNLEEILEMNEKLPKSRSRSQAHCSDLNGTPYSFAFGMMLRFDSGFSD
jgi:hypothetical protein